eukprot:TRINITY_DN10839_c0_g1_i3.p2 TRINITY_DN10839_c0_g1~~TRINITY_DN10839_c0_g1_i3.p2  ORF type:complete len:203 (-),score=14.61 TRINITY_DN10839_c0_g1_i3:24-632(-)
MAPPRRRNRMATRRVPNLGRQQQRVGLQKLGNATQWEALMKKSQNRIIVVYYYREFNLACRRMHQYLLELQKDKKLGKKTIFLQANPEELKGVISLGNVQAYPAIGFYFSGRLRQLMQGVEPQAVRDTLEAHMLEIFGYQESHGWKKWLVGATIAGTAVIMGAAGITLNSLSGRIEGGGSNQNWNCFALCRGSQTKFRKRGK